MRSHIDGLTVAGPTSSGFGSVPLSPVPVVDQLPSARHSAEYTGSGSRS